ncbi:hypothetical protein [Gimesia sp.]|uniref:hypothetical protein n=1 Tax=Gimesia sp. TaxID=2024833 RepID=UPI0032EF74E6
MQKTYRRQSEIPTKLNGRGKDTFFAAHRYKETPPHPYQRKSPTAFLKTLISDIDMGIKDNWEERPTRVSKKYAEAVLESKLKYKERGYSTCFPPQRNNLDFDKHFRNKHTLYYTAGRGEYVLVMLDIDCHRKGSAKGAAAYLKYLKGKFFNQNLYYEASTNGKGIHGYLLLWTDNQNAEAVKDSMKRLQTLLQLDFIENRLDQKYDVEWIEVKGMPMVVDFENDGEFDITLGHLAKIPREITNRFQDFRNTTMINIQDLFDLPDYKKLDPPSKKALAAKTKESGSTGISFDWSRLPYFLAVGEYALTLQPKIACKNGLKVTALDIAIFLLLLEAFSFKYKNKNDEMPFNRFFKFWNDAFQDDEVSRAANRSRITAIKNLCSDIGFITWIDNRYQFFPDGSKKGTCCKWIMSEACKALIDQFETALNVASVAVNNSLNKHTHNYVTGVKYKEKIRPVLMAIELTDRDKLLYFEREALKICEYYSPPEPEQHFQQAV